MGVIRTNNTWGKPGGLEALRNDLWALDLRTVVDAVDGTFGFTPLPDRQITYYYATRVSLPEQAIMEETFLRGNVPVSLPGYDQPTGQVTVDFIVDTNAATGSVSNAAAQAQSSIYMLLYGWRALARVGRGQFSDEPVPLLPTTPNLSPALRTYKCDLNLYLLQGVNTDTTDVTKPSANLTGMAVATRIRLTKCWLSRFKLGELTRGASQVLTISATLVVEDIVPTGFEADVSDGLLPVISG